MTSVGIQKAAVQAVGVLVNASDEIIKDSFKADLQDRFGHVVPSKEVVKMFGVSHGLPVIEGYVSIDAVSRLLLEMRELALSSAM